MLLLLDLTAAFDTVGHDILLTILHSKYSISGIALEWFRSHLTNRSQFVLIEGCRSLSRNLQCGIPQRSVRGPIRYLIYAAPLANILRFHEMQFHFYADDTQLHFSFSTKWLSVNRLKLKKDKTELLYLFSKYNPSQSLSSLRFGTDIIKPSPHAGNIGSNFETTMLILPHVNNVCKSAFYHLCTIWHTRKYLSTQTTEILIHAFLTFKLDHCNSLLYNVPKERHQKASIGAECSCQTDDTL